MGVVILVVDDEPPVRRLIEHVLKSAGHFVYATESAADAIAIAQALGPELDILLCDIFLPQSSGIDVGRQVNAICPTVQTILISGEFPSDDETPFIIDGIPYRVLPKPFTPQQLLNVITLLIN